MDTELAQVAYTGTEYGFRQIGGHIAPAPIGPAEAARYRASGTRVYERQKTAYLPTVTEWVEMPKPASDPGAGVALDYGTGYAAGRASIADRIDRIVDELCDCGDVDKCPETAWRERLSDPTFD